MITPLKNRVLVQRHNAEAKTSGGLIIPDTAKEPTQEGIVIAIGGDVEELTTGEVVIFGKYSGTEIIYNEKDYLIMKESDIYAII